MTQFFEIVCDLKTSYKEVNGSCSAGENRKGPEETTEEPSPVKLSISYIVLKILMHSVCTLECIGSHVTMCQHRKRKPEHRLSDLHSPLVISSSFWN